MGLTYFKRYRMEIAASRLRFDPLLPQGYRLVPWRPGLLDEHASAMHHSFRDEIDACLFDCFASERGCQKLMRDMIAKKSFLAESTWLVEYMATPHKRETAGCIQGMQTEGELGSIQNVGVTPLHRGRGLGATLVYAAMLGFGQIGRKRVVLEVTAQNEAAVRLYRRLGFRRTKTLYKSANNDNFWPNAQPVTQKRVAARVAV